MRTCSRWVLLQAGWQSGATPGQFSKINSEVIWFCSKRLPLLGTSHLCLWDTICCCFPELCGDVLASIRNHQLWTESFSWKTLFSFCLYQESYRGDFLVFLFVCLFVFCFWRRKIYWRSFLCVFHWSNNVLLEKFCVFISGVIRFYWRSFVFLSLES